LHHLPLLLIDAAGPFQDSGYQVAEACIANGVHYIDLADARAFVAGITSLDAAARRAGMSIVTGASSVPALSGAVVERLADGMDDVRAVNLSISASNRATAGASIAAAILSYVGRPVRLWRGRRWVQETGWRMLRWETYRVGGQRPICRLVALSDVPDHDIVPEMIPGRPATAFRAGPEFASQLLLVWLLGWLVQWQWVRSLKSISKWLFPLQKLTAGFGTDRSAMMIEAKGLSDETLLVRRWTLIANEGDGPELPTIAAQLLARAIRDGQVEPGARSAAGLLNLAEFDSELASLAVVWEITTQPYVPLFQRVMGDAFAKLPVPVKRIHTVIGDGGAEGMANVTRGKSILARLVAAIMHFPPEGSHQVHVAFQEDHGIERWTRSFGSHVFESELSQSGEYLVERFGPMRFAFKLPTDASGLEMDMRQWSIFHVPMPMFLAPRSSAKEYAVGDEFVFDVAIGLPLVGDVVRYKGTLRPI
jgi:hypothetical protein